MADELDALLQRMEDEGRRAELSDISAGAMQGAPDVHAVYLDSDDPGKVLVVTQFNSKRDAERFSDTGLMKDFHAELLRCTATSPNFSTYDLFYATGPGERRVIYGEDA